MKAMTDYKNMVVVMTTQGIEVKAALDAAEIVIFGIQEKQEVKPSFETVKTIEPLKGDVVGSKVASNTQSKKKYIDQTLLAERLGMTTQSFNRMLNEKGYLKRQPLLNKPLSSPDLKNVSTYVMTEKGEKLLLDQHDNLRAALNHALSASPL